MFQRKTMRQSIVPIFLLSILLFTLFNIPTRATKKPYIVYLGAHSHGPNPSSVDLESVTSSHYTLLGTFFGSNEKAKDAILYSYSRHINGFAAILDDAEAAEIAKHQDVVSVFLSKGKKLHTTHSWDFLRLERNGVIPSKSIWKKARYGEDTIIGNLDTGIWPESKSFSDEGFGPIPSKWRGICQHGIRDKIHCNRKLIGARYFNKGYAAYLKKINLTLSPRYNSTLFTTRDYEGHGTYTLSVAGGNFVHGANVMGNGNGTAKGGSPRARMAAYKVCWPPVDDEECFDADILAAIDVAISDGVDVLSLSLGNDEPLEYFKEAISIGAFHAVKNGIVVVTSAGNSGPKPSTVWDVSPWTLTVGASTIDREFVTYVALGNKKHLKGASLSSKALPSQKFYPLISGADAKTTKATTLDALNCIPGTLDPKKVNGKILVCLWEQMTGLEIGQQAALAGAVGMILANDFESGNQISPDLHVLPASHISFSDGQLVFDYLKSSKFPMAYMTRVKTELGVKPAPIMASFSSRGPNIVEKSILKPDVTAPGVDIIGAYTEAVGPTFLASDTRRVPFIAQSGTSISCPHVSGVASLLKTLHPDWSPAAIKSAIMTTARTRANNMEPMLNSSMKRATPFEYGAGHIRPNHAMDPGLVYDLTIDDYLNFLCAYGYNQTIIRKFSDKQHRCSKSFTMAKFNYPSIVVPNLGSKPVTVTRKVKNVGSPGVYTAYVKAPACVSISVNPKSLKFNGIGEEKKFKIVVKQKVAVKPKEYVFGRLKWSDGKHHVRSPIVVKHK